LFTNLREDCEKYRNRNRESARDLLIRRQRKRVAVSRRAGQNGAIGWAAGVVALSMFDTCDALRAAPIECIAGAAGTRSAAHRSQQKSGRPVGRPVRMSMSSPVLQQETRGLRLRVNR